MSPDDWSTCKLLREQMQSSSPMIGVKTSTPSSSDSEKYIVDVESGLIHGKAVDKAVILGLQAVSETRSTRLARWGRLFICAVVLCGAFFSIPAPPFHHDFTGLLSSIDVTRPSSMAVASSKDVCPQASPIAPVTHADLLEDLEEEFDTKEFKLKAYESLGAAVRVP